MVGICTAGAATATVTINSTSAIGVGGPLGTVSFTDSALGLVITYKLSGLPPESTGLYLRVTPSGVTHCSERIKLGLFTRD